MNDSSAQPGLHKHALVEMIQVAAPTVVTMTSYTVMQFIDGLMVSRIGPDSVYVAAQGNGGMVVWLAMAAFLGLISVLNTYVSQNLGAGKPEEGASYAWNGLWLAVLGALLILPMAAALPWLFRTIHPGPELAHLRELETAYAQILCAGAFLTMASRSIAHYFYGMHMPMIVMIAALTGNVINVAANAVLIFGPEGPPAATPFAGAFAATAAFLGTPAMGVAGAAAGTLIGTGVELAIPLLVFLGPRLNARYGTRRAWRPSRARMKDILRLGWPAGLMFANEMICWGYLMAYLLAAGARAAGGDPIIHNTAGWIALRYMHVSFMPAVGLSIAVTAIVGRCMGMGRPDLAARRAWLGLGITLGYMGLCAVVFVVFREWLIEQFIPADLPEESVRELIAVGAWVMIAAAVFQLFDAVAIVISGALRGAGDTVWPGIVTVVLSWVCIVGLGHAMIALAPGLGSLGPWIGASAFIITVGLAVLGRFIGGKWRTISLVKPPAGTITPEAAPLTAPADAVAGTTPGST